MVRRMACMKGKITNNECFFWTVICKKKGEEYMLRPNLQNVNKGKVLSLIFLLRENTTIHLLKSTFSVNQS